MNFLQRTCETEHDLHLGQSNDMISIMTSKYSTKLHKLLLLCNNMKWWRNEINVGVFRKTWFTLLCLCNLITMVSQLSVTEV